MALPTSSSSTPPSRRLAPRFKYNSLCLVASLLAIHFLYMAKVHYELDSRLKDVVAATHLPPSRNGQHEHDSVSDSDRSISDMNKLKQISFPHGSFFFGANSHQVKIPKSQVFDPSLSWLPLQRKLLDDSDIDVEVEKKRCASYKFGFPNTTMPLRRRRLFYGALISDDSAEVIKATSMEQYNIFHTVSLIESNKTHNLTPRDWKYFGTEDASKKLSWLYQLFGPKTKVSMDYYIPSLEKLGQGLGQGIDAMYLDYFQREGHVYRWKFNGMRPDDVAIIGDLDETYSRDFLRALQICDVPQFRPAQDCKAPKVIASTVIFESSPECTWKGRRWFHPDAVLGECVDQIGDTKLHPPTKRNKWESHGMRLNGYGNYGNYSRYEADVLKPLNMTGQYPLWLPSEIRIEVGGALFEKKDEWKSPTGYHYHNFFMSGEEVRYKYLTYGHPDGKAFEKPLQDLHGGGDLLLAVTCAEGNHTEQAERSFESLPGTSKPIYYLNEEARRARHSIWQDIVRKDAENATKNEVKAKVDPTPATEGKQQHKSLTSSKSHWDSSKSAVLGLASGYPRYVYEGFVGSLRATGFAGHIILAIAKDAPLDVVSYLGEQNVTMKYVEKAEKCTYNGAIGENGKPIDMQKSSEWKCPKDYPDYKITWSRFLYYRDWLNDCPSCTDGVMLTDVRDAFFQRDPFVTAVERNQVHPLMVFEESPETNTEHWLTDWPVSACRKHKLGKNPMLCSGSVMGSREGILDYIDVMEEEFKYWMERENCRIDNRGDDQSIHNYLYYTNRFKNAVSIPHRQGPIHVVGYQAARIFENATKEAENAGVGISEIFIHDNNWKEWLPRKYGLINTNTGLIVNEDGTPSAQVHQVDRFGPLISKWENEMKKQGWPYNKDKERKQQHNSLTSSKSHWDSSKSAVLGLASGYPRYVYEGFVGSLRATGFAGHIILAIAKDAPSDVVSYLGEQNVTMKYVEKAEKCTYNGTIGESGKPIDMQKSSEWKCPKDYPDYKITWSRFLYYRDWLNDCPSCTDGVMLTDVRDAFFQRDPFVTAVERNQVHPLMVFEESPETDTEHWLTDWPVSACRKHKLGKNPMLCSGSVMGSREGILDYIDVMEEEFKYWMERENCRIDNRGDDQSIHNYLYYTNRFKNAVSIPHRQGPIHVVGYQAARIFENATKEAENAGVGISEIFIHDNNWKEWLPRKYGLINTNTGLIVNEDGTPSAQVHQVDRFGPLISKWENEMKKQGWPYNKDKDKESIGSSA